MHKTVHLSSFNKKKYIEIKKGIMLHINNHNLIIITHFKVSGIIIMPGTVDILMWLKEPPAHVSFALFLYIKSEVQSKLKYLHIY